MTEPIHVFLDTSALPRNPAYLGLGFESLCQLARSGFAKPYISSIVEREWRSQREKEWIDLASQASRGLKKLLKHPWSVKLNEDSALSNAFDGLSLPSYRMQHLSRESSDLLIERLEAEVLPIDKNHAPEVFDRYFEGQLPFTSPKSRKDIPDAFIRQAAIDLVERLDNELHCVIGDGSLRNSLSFIDRIVMHETLGEFARTKPVRALTKELPPAQLWAATLSTLLKRLPKAELALSGQLDDALADELLWEMITHQLIPEDNREGMITMVYETVDVSFDWNSTIDFGPGLLAIPFEALVPATLSFMVFRGDAVPDGVSVDYGDLASEHYYDAEGQIEVEVEGLAATRFNLDELGEDDLPHLQQVGIHQLERIEPIEQEPGTIFHASSTESS